MTKHSRAPLVFVGMSGGVDSSVSAYLLQQAGYDVVGVFIKVWHPDFLPCHWERERLDAMRVAAHLGIPFLTCDAEAVYKKDVADYFIAEYAAGRTPNPDVMCNTHVKFGAFYEFAKAHGADFIATGHYARVTYEVDHATLLRGVDAEKDQSYFLWNIDARVLAHTLFPIGGYTKKEVRALAHRAGIPTAQKRESQGICFLGHVDIPSFLSHFITLTPGKVLTKDGKVVGTHEGALLYTIGQRHGFHIASAQAHTHPYYVTAKDTERNIIIVSDEKPSLPDTGTYITLENAWVSSTSLPLTCTLQTRYRQPPTPCVVSTLKDRTLTVTLRHAAEHPALGQSCVLYDRERVVGGGIIAALQAEH